MTARAQASQPVGSDKHHAGRVTHHARYLVTQGLRLLARYIAQTVPAIRHGTIDSASIRETEKALTWGLFSQAREITSRA